MEFETSIRTDGSRCAKDILIYYGGIIMIMMICAIILVGNILAGKYYNPSKFIEQRDEDVQDSLQSDGYLSQPKPIVTLIVTTARSGSTWVGKLLDLIDDSFYLYEPIHALVLDKLDFTTGFDLVEQLLHCGISPVLINGLRAWKWIYIPKNCPKNRHECTSAKTIADDCHRSKYRSMKLIRIRLGLIEKILNTKSMENLKIIYLVRDPRGTLASISSVKKIDKLWDPLKPNVVCSKIREDVYSFQMLATLYPNNVYLLRYEDIALNPFEKSAEMWHFMNNNTGAPIPNKWHNYLRTSQLPKKRIPSYPYDQSHKSTNEWQLWRQTISEELYNDAVGNCDDLIRTLGYRAFESFAQMRESANSSLAVDKCYSLPCTIS